MPATTCLEVGTEVLASEGVVRRVVETSTGMCVSETPAGPNANTSDPLGEWWRSYLLGYPIRRIGEPRGIVRSVDLFCGPGGLANGLRQAAAELGLEHRSMAAIDQDAEAVDVYAANHHTRVRITESVSMLVDYNLSGGGTTASYRYEPELLQTDLAGLRGHVDVVLAGPPCQGHSNLNNHSRRDDRRNELYLTVPAIAIALDAPMVIIENVPSVIHDSLEVVATTRHLLETQGYAVDQGVVSASEMGWPQSRRRFFLIARKDRPPIPIAEVAASLKAPMRPIRWVLDDVDFLEADPLLDHDPELSVENRRRIDWLFDHDEHDLPDHQRPKSHQNGTTYTAVYGRLHPDRPAPTITTGFMTPGRGRYIHPTERRTLRPREAAWLQGFPDTYRFQTDPDSPPSTGQLAKWIGDAVPMPLGYAAGLAALAPGWES